MTNEAQLLREYAEEMGLFGPLTLEKLIASHRHLRAQSIRRSDELRAEQQRAVAHGEQQGLELVTKGRYISHDDLRKMTLAEISAMLYDGDDDWK
jgi:hypothetical protein